MLIIAQHLKNKRGCIELNSSTQIDANVNSNKLWLQYKFTNNKIFKFAFRIVQQNKFAF